MKQFYESYKDSPKLSALLREISWSNAEYQTQLPDKKLLQQKLHELFDAGNEIS